MTLKVNGQSTEVADGISVAELLRSLRIGTAGVAVEVNAEIVRKAAHAERRLSAGDAVEIVTFVGGG